MFKSSYWDLSTVWDIIEISYEILEQTQSQAKVLV